MYRHLDVFGRKLTMFKGMIEHWFLIENMTNRPEKYFLKCCHFRKIFTGRFEDMSVENLRIGINISVQKCCTIPLRLLLLRLYYDK